MTKKMIVLLTAICLALPFLVIGTVYFVFKINVFDNPDFWYGYLSYFGTVVLATVAVWQNTVFKEENDNSQARLEKLTSQANELSIIRKIIENETQNFSRLRVAFDEFSHACDLERIVAVYFKCIKNFDDLKSHGVKAAILSEMHTLRNQIECSLIVLYRETGLFNDEKNPDRKIIKEYYDVAMYWIDEIIDHSKVPNNKEVDNFNQIKNFFIDYREKYLREKSVKLKSIIYDDMTLVKIKELYALKTKVE